MTLVMRDILWTDDMPIQCPNFVRIAVHCCSLTQKVVVVWPALWSGLDLDDSFDGWFRCPVHHHSLMLLRGRCYLRRWDRVFVACEALVDWLGILCSCENIYAHQHSTSIDDCALVFWRL